MKHIAYGNIAQRNEEKEAIKDEKEYQVGIDALTIAVNPENPVTGVLDDLSTEQIVSLFSGKYATWKDLDPSLPDEKVVVITRDINGGAHEVFQKNIMGDTEVSSEAIQASSMGELVQDIIDNKYAIGYASFGVANQNAGKVVTLKVNGVEPTKENIIDGSWTRNICYSLITEHTVYFSCTYRRILFPVFYNEFLNFIICLVTNNMRCSTLIT